MANHFPYADVNKGAIEAVALDMPEYSDSATPPTGLGFTLISGKLVPNGFLYEICIQLQGRVNCYDVIGLDELFTPYYLVSLTASEMAVLGECVLLLIERGDVCITLIDKKKQARKGSTGPGSSLRT